VIIEELVTVLGVDVEAEGVPELIQGVTKATALVAGLVAAAKTVTGALDSAFRAAAENTELARFAAGIGQSTQVIQELEFAGQRFGVSIGEIRNALAGLESDLDDVASGRGEDTLVSLAKLGVDTEGLRDELDLFRRIADGFQSAIDQNPGLARGALRDLGLGSPEFVALLRGGTAQIDALAAEARELGRIVSEDTVDVSQRYVIATERIGAAIDGLVNRHLVPGLEVVADFTEELTEMITTLNPEELTLVQELKAIVGFLQEAQDLLNSLGASLRGADEKIAEQFGRDPIVQEGSFADPVSAGATFQRFIADLLSRAPAPIPVPGAAFIPQIRADGRVTGAGVPSEIRVENRADVVIHAGGDAREAAEGFRNERDSLTIKSLREAMRVNAGVEN
jgi:hypothetical protein